MNGRKIRKVVAICGLGGMFCLVAKILSFDAYIFVGSCGSKHSNTN